jgi:hypothetical protein
VTRDELVSALSTVAGLTPSVTQPPVLAPYAAWPIRGRLEGINQCAYRQAWQVAIVLPAGDRTATVLDGDRLIDPIYQALSKVGFVTGGEPSAISPEEGGQNVPILLFDVTE